MLNTAVIGNYKEQMLIHSVFDCIFLEECAKLAHTARRRVETENP